ncbi:DUF4340 domain-containing protein [Algiphilus sp.]|uniref:DUF4340 domain-containing protein n=1 Tax=Algiphilus sp. TaxID=1872431 RepID=UPI003C4ECD9E
MHRHIVNLVLLFLLGAGAVLVWRATQPEPTATAPLVTDQRDRIQRAGFATPDGGRVLLERVANGWRLREPVDAPADPTEVNSLLSVASAAVHERFGLNEVDAADLGLDRPERRLFFDDTDIAIGAVNPVTRQRFVQVGDDTVAQIDDPAGAPRNATHANFVHKRIVAADRELTRIDLPRWIVEKRDASWSARARGHDGTRDAARAAETAEAWRTARAMWTRPLDAVDAGSGEAVTLHFADGGSTALVAERGQQLILARPGYRVRYHVARNLAGVLLDLAAPPAAPETDPTTGKGVMAPAGN